MAKKTTYQKLILKIILTTLFVSLSVGFIYAEFIKQDAIEKLTKIDAKKTTQLVFQSLYSAMEKGWDRTDLEKIIHRVNDIDENMKIDVYRSEKVEQEFGKIQKNQNAKQNNEYIQKALLKDEILNIVDNTTIDYYYPIVAKNECSKCHTNSKAEDVLGVINITYPIDDLKVSLSSIINFFIVFIIIFSIIIFIALFIEFDKYLISPIKNFIVNINSISKHKDITKRVEIKNDIQEINSMQDVFNKMLDSLEFQFYYDELTSLPNRKRLIEVLAQEENAVLFIINIDKFQQINDLYGENIGDDILKNTAQIIKENISPKAELYKLHADEYAIYYPSSLLYEEIESLATHLTNVVHNHTFTIDDSEIFIHITVGIAYGNSFLLNNSDIALKLAKKKKRKYLIYESSMNIEHEYEQNLKWAKKIKDAIRDNKIEPLFQPIVDTKTQKVVKYEALMRMIDEDEEFISPIHFLDLAKKNKLYPELTKIMITKTFDTFQNLDSKVSINLSVEDILDETVSNTIIENLINYNIGHKVIFELIESEGIENFEEIINFIEKVKRVGAKISIDDFGTGYSNFEYLMKLKVDFIKIDASMIKNIDKNRDSQLVTETIIDFAKKMNIKTVAEFIHSKDVYLVVKDMGIDYAQGYYFGEPKRINPS